MPDLYDIEQIIITVGSKLTTSSSIDARFIRAEASSVGYMRISESCLIHSRELC